MNSVTTLPPVPVQHVQTATPDAPAQAPVAEVSPRFNDICVDPIAMTPPAHMSEAVFALRAAYDTRATGADATPRGVEIDRIEMIREGFEHMRSVLSTISENAAASGAGETLDTTM